MTLPSAELHPEPSWAARSIRSGGSEISFPVPHRVFTLHAHFDFAKRIGRAARVGIVAEAVLGAQLAVDAVEDGVELFGGVGKKHGAAGGFGDGLNGVLAGSVAAALVFHGADDDGVKQRAGTQRAAARGLEVGLAGG